MHAGADSGRGAAQSAYADRPEAESCAAISIFHTRPQAAEVGVGDAVLDVSLLYQFCPAQLMHSNSPDVAI